MTDGAIRALTFRALTRVRGPRRWATSFAAGALAALALAPVYALPLLVAGFSALVLLIDGAVEDTRPRAAAFAVGWWFGFGYFLVGLYWMAFSFFVQAEAFAWMAPFAMLGMPSFLALFYGAAAAAAAALWRPGPRRVLLLAAFFALFEYARGHILTGLPWNLPGQALAGAAALAQVAALIGAYGLTLLTIALAAAPAAFVDREKNAGSTMMRGAFITLAGAAAMLIYGSARLALTPSQDDEAGADAPVHVRIVQPNIPQREKIDPSLWGRNVQRAIEMSSAPGPDGGELYVVWPENAAALIDEYEDALAAVDRELPKGAILIAGAVRRERPPEGAPDDAKQRFYNAVSIIVGGETGRRAAAHYDKHHLVPFGEYLPLEGLLRAVGLAQLAPFEDGFRKGPGPQTFDIGARSFSPLICYETIFPGRLHPRGDRPDWLVSVTNDAWFGDTSGPRQHLDQARLRTIESGLPMARSANTGVSALIDGAGRYRGRLALYEAGVIDAVLPKPLAPTLYARIGDALFWLMTAAALAFGLSLDRWRPTRG